jgi:hypothetical protein
MTMVMVSSVLSRKPAWRDSDGGDDDDDRHRGGGRVDGVELGGDGGGIAETQTGPGDDGMIAHEAGWAGMGWVFGCRANPDSSTTMFAAGKRPWLISTITAAASASRWLPDIEAATQV